jgi:hypothetical protein
VIGVIVQAPDLWRVARHGAQGRDSCVGMYLRETRRMNRDGSVVAYL